MKFANAQPDQWIAGFAAGAAMEALKETQYSDMTEAILRTASDSNHYHDSEAASSS
jgi:hypothetical protein